MAISRDTAALVAAQLTTAWAVKSGAAAGSVVPADDQVLAIYRKILDEISRKDGSGLFNVV